MRDRRPRHGEHLLLGRHTGLHRLSHELLGVLAKVGFRYVCLQQGDCIACGRVRLQGLPRIVSIEADEQILAEHPLSVFLPRGVQQKRKVEKHNLDQVLAGRTRSETGIDASGEGNAAISSRWLPESSSNQTVLPFGRALNSPVLDELLDQPQAPTSAGHCCIPTWGRGLRAAVGNLDAETDISDRGMKIDRRARMHQRIRDDLADQECAVSTRSSRCAAVKTSRTILRAMATLDG